MPAVIHVENLGKRYRIGERERYFALRDVLTRAIFAPARLFQARKRRSPNGDPTHIWALKDVSFDVQQGEVVGIIGRNGSGKTTLLKILAQVTRPTEGRARVRGRIGSLLEVGTGFHPELTGRENVFLSGAILGMTKAEILRKFDEIVAFAEVEKFLDTPLKHYSTGMQMRLAFAVAAHLEPEILLVDEVLAVGDMQFQKKCLGKMREVSREGRTVLFVSHNMGAVVGLCSRGLLLNMGGIERVGNISEVVAKYLQLRSEQEEVIPLHDEPRQSWLKGGARLLWANLNNPDKVGRWTLPYGAPIRLTVGLELLRQLGRFEMGVQLFTPMGFEISSSLSFHDIGYLSLQAGQYAFNVEFPNLALVPASYKVGFGLRSERGQEDLLPEVIDLEVVTTDESAALNIHSILAVIAPKARFQLRRLDSDPSTANGTHETVTWTKEHHR
jgi:lipopolysaccharide transport system ATP-binding protein